MYQHSILKINRDQARGEFFADYFGFQHLDMRGILAAELWQIEDSLRPIPYFDPSIVTILMLVEASQIWPRLRSRKEKVNADVGEAPGCPEPEDGTQPSDDEMEVDEGECGFDEVADAADAEEDAVLRLLVEHADAVDEIAEQDKPDETPDAATGHDASSSTGVPACPAPLPPPQHEPEDEDTAPVAPPTVSLGARAAPSTGAGERQAAERGVQGRAVATINLAGGRISYYDKRGGFFEATCRSHPRCVLTRKRTKRYISVDGSVTAGPVGLMACFLADAHLPDKDAHWAKLRSDEYGAEEMATHEAELALDVHGNHLLSLQA